MVSCKSWVPFEVKKKWVKPVAQSPVFKKTNTGFALYDLNKGELISHYQGDKRFTPASNTKLFTVFASLETFGKKLPVIQYRVVRDTLVLFPVGFPGFHYVNDSGIQALDSLINTIDLPVRLLLPMDAIVPYGSGWAWDDSGYIWQVPRSAFPIFGNRLRRISDSTFISLDSAIVSAPNFDLPLNSQIERLHNAETGLFPFLPDSVFLQRTLSFSNKLEIIYTPGDDYKGETQSIHVDAIPFYKRVLENSDNFLSEQLLLMAGKMKTGSWKIDSLVTEYERGLGQGGYIRWEDGSGLSRYNSFSPMQIIYLLEKMIEKNKEETILEILPEGGKEGTIGIYYKSLPQGTLFAKTGTLTGVHCLSGILKTKKGKTLLFSFMHNQIPGSNGAWKREMERLLLEIHSKN